MFVRVFRKRIGSRLQDDGVPSGTESVDETIEEAIDEVTDETFAEGLPISKDESRATRTHSIPLVAAGREDAVKVTFCQVSRIPVQSD